MSITSLNSKEGSVPSVLNIYAVSKVAGMANNIANDESENILFFKNSAAQCMNPLQIRITQA